MHNTMVIAFEIPCLRQPQCLYKQFNIALIRREYLCGWGDALFLRTYYSKRLGQYEIYRFCSTSCFNHIGYPPHIFPRSMRPVSAQVHEVLKLPKSNLKTAMGL